MGAGVAEANEPIHDLERDLLFGVLALQLGLVDEPSFVESCAAWTLRRSASLRDLMRDRGRIDPAEVAAVEKALALRDRRGPAASRAVADGRPPVEGSIVSVDTGPSGVALRFHYGRIHRKGGLGQIRLGKDLEIGRRVAIKEIRPEHSDRATARDRFLREARITGRLEHPSIVPVYALGTWPWDGTPYYVMRFVAGRSLREAIADYFAAKGSRPVADTLGRRRLLTGFVSVCKAVAFAHSRGVVHRDLKPDNIMIGDFGEVILLDWGLAKYIDRAAAEAQDEADWDHDVPTPAESPIHLTTGRQLLGTPAYMAPEQAEGRNEAVGRATDVYGLGAVLFDIISGRAPHQGDSTQAVLHRIKTEPTPKLRDVDPTAPAGLEEICAHAMARLPEHRFSSALALAEAVEGWLADEPLVAYRASVDYFVNLVVRYPGNTGYRSRLARERSNLGLVLAGLDRLEEAGDQYRAAIREYEALAAAEPEEPRHRANLANNWVLLRRIFVTLGHDHQAEAARERSLKWFATLAADRRADPDYGDELENALATMDLGPATEIRRQIAEARAATAPAASPTAADADRSETNIRLDEPESSLVIAIDESVATGPPGPSPPRKSDTVVEDPIADALPYSVGPDDDELADLTVSPPPRIAPVVSVPPPPSEPVDEALGDLTIEPPPALARSFQPPPAAPRSPSRADHEGLFGNRFVDLKAIGQGGMSEIFAATDQLLQRRVALKVARHGTDETFAAINARRHLDEARMWARVEHDHIPPVYGYGTSSGGHRAYLVTKLIEGPTLRDALQAFHANPPPGPDAKATALAAWLVELERLVRVVLTVAQALDHAHGLGVLHCDPKPANVLLGREGHPYLIDWGVSRLIDSGEAPPFPLLEPPKPGQVFGTAGYLAPEMAKGDDPLDVRTDVYVLGAALFEVLTGRRRFQDEERLGFVHVLIRLTSGDEARPRDVLPAIPVELDEICARSIAHDPGRRFPTMSAFADALAAYFRG